MSARIADLTRGRYGALRLDQQLDWNEVAEVLSGDGTAVEPTAMRKRYGVVAQKIHPIKVAQPEPIAELSRSGPWAAPQPVTAHLDESLDEL